MFDPQREGLTAADAVELVRGGLIGQQDPGVYGIDLLLLPASNIGPAAGAEHRHGESLRSVCTHLARCPGQADPGAVAVHQRGAAAELPQFDARIDLLGRRFVGDLGRYS